MAPKALASGALLLSLNLFFTLVRLSVTPCCSLIQGLVDLEAAVWLCTAIKSKPIPWALTMTYLFPPVCCSITVERTSPLASTAHESIPTSLCLLAVLIIVQS
ncbi:hypothetical protein SLEP1_g46017 [Rubroshorea leprosula]|uniref:Hydrophobic seed protein domain-containing protein n=1 Tax=Rubroshorea leprosula TaxID=152421 RepID=A0AAV5LLM3_9ROSI|nr:hypothetical protein SLEP1_g46017 [Rubroshorea leprosula]